MRLPDRKGAADFSQGIFPATPAGDTCRRRHACRRRRQSWRVRRWFFGGWDRYDAVAGPYGLNANGKEWARIDANRWLRPPPPGHSRHSRAFFYIRVSELYELPLAGFTVRTRMERNGRESRESLASASTARAFATFACILFHSRSRTRRASAGWLYGLNANGKEWARIDASRCHRPR